MTTPAEINSMSAQCSQFLGQMSAAGCTREPHCCLVRIANVRNLLSADELHISIALRTVAKTFVSTECHCGKLLIRWGSMDSPASEMQSASPDIQTSTPISKGHSPAFISLNLGAYWLDRAWEEPWWIDFGPWVKRPKPSISGVFKGRREWHLPQAPPLQGPLDVF